MRTRAPRAARRRRVTLQHMGLSEMDMDPVRDALHTVGDDLALSFELSDSRGEVVLMDADLAARMPPQLLASLADGRPLVVLSAPRGEDGLWLRRGTPVDSHHRQLLRQLQSLPLVRRHSAPDRGGRGAANQPQAATPAMLQGGIDSSNAAAERLPVAPLASAQFELLQAVRRGLSDPRCAPLHASYGVQANLRFDFNHRIVKLDPLAQRLLRVERELPSAAAQTMPADDATVRELDETAWDLGIAGGRHALLDAPVDWWNGSLSAPAPGAVQRHTLLPRHLALARYFEAGPTTPAELRRQARADIGDLRRFLQACLLLGLVRWLPQTHRQTQRQTQNPSTPHHPGAPT